MRILDKDQAELDAGASWAWRRPRWTAFRARPASSPTASSWSPAPPARARPPRSTPRLGCSTTARRNILTVEDPVEYAVDGVGQTQVNTKVGMTFAAGLRAILRQDPDVVMVGEIRDVETARDRRRRPR